MIRDIAASLAAAVALSVTAWWAGPAHPQAMADISGSTVLLQPSQRAGAVAEVVLNNLQVNDEGDEGPRLLTMRGMTVMVTFRFNHRGGDDAVVVTPPDGIVCLPVDCVLVVIEGFSGTLWLFDVEAASS